MTKEEWKKNDAILKAALKKMQLSFRRDKTTWEPHVHRGRYEYSCYDEDDYEIIGGLIDVESLGETKTFYRHATLGKDVQNIFFGVNNYEELKIKLDLMA